MSKLTNKYTGAAKDGAPVAAAVSTGCRFVSQLGLCTLAARGGNLDMTRPEADDVVAEVLKLLGEMLGFSKEEAAKVETNLKSRAVDVDFPMAKFKEDVGRIADVFTKDAECDGCECGWTADCASVGERGQDFGTQIRGVGDGAVEDLVQALGGFGLHLLT